MRKRAFPALFSLLALAFLCGCVKQNVKVTSDPDGARVFFDGYYKGETPVEFPFKWHGDHRLSVEKEGYERVSEKITLRAPAHLAFPADLLSELAPFNVRSDHSFHYDLRPKE